MTKVFDIVIRRIQDTVNLHIQDMCLLFGLAFAGTYQIVKNIILDIGDCVGCLAKAIRICQVVYELISQRKGVMETPRFGVKTRLGLTDTAERDCRSHPCLTKKRILFLKVGHQDLGFEASCLDGVLELVVVDKPGVVVTLNTALPVLIFQVINCVWCYDDTVIFPIFDASLGVDAGILTIGDNVVVVWQVHFEEAEQAFLTGVGRALVVFVWTEFCHIER